MVLEYAASPVGIAVRTMASGLPDQDNEWVAALSRVGAADNAPIQLTAQAEARHLQHVSTRRTWESWESLPCAGGYNIKLGLGATRSRLTRSQAA